MSGRTWSHEESALLLLWVDHTIKQDVKFLETSFEPIDSRFEKVQIRNKLVGLARRYGPQVGTTYLHGILTHGTSYFIRDLGTAMNNAIEEARALFEDGKNVKIKNQQADDNLPHLNIKNTNPVDSDTTEDRPSKSNRRDSMAPTQENDMTTSPTSSWWSTTSQKRKCHEYEKDCNPPSEIMLQRKEHLLQPPVKHQRYGEMQRELLIDNLNARKDTNSSSLSLEASSDGKEIVRTSGDDVACLASKPVVLIPYKHDDHLGQYNRTLDTSNSSSLNKLTCSSDAKNLSFSRSISRSDRQSDSQLNTSTLEPLTRTPQTANSSPHEVQTQRTKAGEEAHDKFIFESKLEKSVQLRLETAKFEIDRLKEKIIRLEEEKCNEKAEAARQAAELSRYQQAWKLQEASSKEENRRLLAEKDKKFKEYEALMVKREELAQFTRQSPISVARLGTRSLIEDFENIYSDARKISYGGSNVALLPVSSAVIDKHLRDLLCAFGSEDVNSADFENSRWPLKIANPELLVRVLANSALVRWVLDTDLPRLWDEPCSRLKSYQEMLQLQQNPTGLRNFDMAVNSSVINTPKSRRVLNITIHKDAERLTGWFTNALAPLFTSIPLSIQQDVHGWATWGLEGNDYESRNNRIFQFFEQALQTKMKSRLNIEEYEMVIFPRGTLYCANTMDVEDREGFPVPRGKVQKSRKVEICVQGALLSFPRKMEDDVQVEDALMPLNNFKRKVRAGGKVIIKSIVVLEDISV